MTHLTKEQKVFLDRVVNGEWLVNQETGLIDVNGSISINEKIEILPISFGEVTGFFHCTFSGLQSLEGCPRWVGGSFDCSHNKLKNLKHSPIYVGDRFSFIGNPLLEELGCCDMKAKSILIDLGRVNPKFHANIIPEIEVMIDSGLLLVEPEQFYYPFRDAYYESKVSELL